MYNELIKYIYESANIVVLTGAGVSTGSGIPDYRSKDGLYTQGNPEYLLSLECLANEPDKFYSFVKENMIYPYAKPNNIHKGLAALEATHDVKIITQNVDGLHTTAGSTNVIEFHGSLNRIKCMGCNGKFSLEEYLESDKCPVCGGTLRPDAILYGEDPGMINLGKGIDAITKADLVIVIGTSLQVYPFASLMEYVKPTTKKVLINKEEISSQNFDLSIIEDANDIFQYVFHI